ncbi:bactofilin family protein [Oceanobacillus salinisoli]|uniref:bactofilin family protein n=1 Tax=Oceanobacillus salinisoli TaxID=2678611 RepID=UPI0012E159AC|nr:polymer-forming cytoskeletal protein [Oceanobacillus salinisoli]
MKLKERKDKIIDTIIGQGTVIEGKINHPSSLRIDGKVYGEVECTGDIYIGKDGYVEPMIKGKNIYIAGEVKGELFTTEKLHVQASGKLSGSATTKGMIIDDGGVFNGDSKVVENDNKSVGKKKYNSNEKVESK